MVLIMAVTGRRHAGSSQARRQPRYSRVLSRLTRKRSPIFRKILSKLNVNLQRKLRPHCCSSRGNWHPRGTGPASPTSPNPYYSSLPQGADGQAPSDPIRDEKRKRAYFSLFSDNVALTYRKELRSDRHSGNASLATNGLVPRVPTVSDAFPTQDPLVAQAGAELAREGQLFAQAQQAGLIPQLPLPAAVRGSAQDHSASKRVRPRSV